MKDERYKRYRMRKFQDWKDRVKTYLPSLAIKFYTAKSKIYIPYEKERLLGAVIEAINNPFYSLVNSRTGDLCSDTDKMTLEIILEIQVNEIFAYVNTYLTPINNVSNNSKSPICNANIRLKTLNT